MPEMMRYDSSTRQCLAQDQAGTVEPSPCHGKALSEGRKTADGSAVEAGLGGYTTSPTALFLLSWKFLYVVTLKFLFDSCLVILPSGNHEIIELFVFVC